MSTDKARTAEVPVVAWRYNSYNPFTRAVSEKWTLIHSPRQRDALSADYGQIPEALVRQSDYLAAMEALRAEIAARDARIARMARALETVRMYPDFDEGGPLPDMIDAVLADGPETAGEAFMSHIDASTGQPSAIPVGGSLTDKSWLIGQTIVPNIMYLYADGSGINATQPQEPADGSLVHPDDAAKAGAATGPGFDPMR